MPPVVTYVTGQPKSEDTLKSACDGGDGYICSRFMLFSPEMIQAAKDDAAANSWPGDAFNYGVATLDGGKRAVLASRSFTTNPRT